MTAAALLAIIQGQINLITLLIDSQTPAQKLLMWDRYITLTAPMHALLMRIEKVTPEEIAGINAETLAALGVPAAPAAPAPGAGAFPTVTFPSVPATVVTK